MKRSLLAHALGIALALAPVSASAMKAISVHGLKAMTWEAQFNLGEVEQADPDLSSTSDGQYTEALLAYAGEDPADILGYTGVVFTDGESAAILQALTRLVGTRRQTSPTTMDKFEMASTHAQKAADGKLAEMIHATITASEHKVWEKALAITNSLPTEKKPTKILPKILSQTPNARPLNPDIQVIRDGPPADLGLKQQIYVDSSLHQHPVMTVQSGPKTYDVGDNYDKKKSKLIKGKFTKGTTTLTTTSGQLEVASH